MRDGIEIKCDSTLKYKLEDLDSGTGSVTSAYYLLLLYSIEVKKILAHDKLENILHARYSAINKNYYLCLLKVCNLEKAKHKEMSSTPYIECGDKNVHRSLCSGEGT